MSETTAPSDRRPQASNEELARRAQSGCLASFDEILRRFQSPLLHFLQLRGRAAEAEDVLQETFLRAFRRLHLYRPTARFSTWLYTIARHTNINYHRRARPECGGEALSQAISPASDPCERVLAGERRRRLWQAIEEVLREDEQTALWLHYVEDIPLADVAVVLERSVPAVKTMMFRARQKLRPMLEDLAPEGVPRRVLRRRQNSPWRYHMDNRLRLWHEADDSDRPLIERLRRAARGDRPAFSDELHTRLSSAIAAEAAQRPAPRARRQHAFVASLVAAAAVCLAVMLVHYRNSDRKVAGTLRVPSASLDCGGSPPLSKAVEATASVGPPRVLQSEGKPSHSKVTPLSPQQDSSDLDAVAEAADRAGEEVQSWFDAAAQAQKWGGLDVDLLAAAQSLSGPLPVDVYKMLADDEIP